MKDFRSFVAVTALVMPIVAGCAVDPGPVFADADGREISCMQHQPAPPGGRYTELEGRRTGDVLAVLRYYTANGRKPYCDGAGPTETDRAWAEFYVRQGAEPSNVAPLLDG